MTIADKILRAKQDYDDVFLAGKAQGGGGGTDRYDEGFEAGKQAEYDSFWNNVQENGTRTRYNYAFAGDGWTDATFTPKYPFGAISHATYMFGYSLITEVKQTLDFSTIANNLANTFTGSKIKTLRLKLSETVGANNMFMSCADLVNLEIEGRIGKNGFNFQWSPLSHDSLMSIINALADKTGDTSGTAWKITIGATNKAKLTAEELEIAENKGWGVD